MSRLGVMFGCHRCRTLHFDFISHDFMCSFLPHLNFYDIHVFDVSLRCFTLRIEINQSGAVLLQTPRGVFCPDRIAPAEVEVRPQDSYRVREELINVSNRSVSQATASYILSLPLSLGVVLPMFVCEISLSYCLIAIYA